MRNPFALRKPSAQEELRIAKAGPSRLSPSMFSQGNVVTVTLPGARGTVLWATRRDQAPDSAETHRTR